MSWYPAADPLLELARNTARGPKREGCFALWLVARVAQDLFQMTGEGTERAHRRRVVALEARCTSLTVPAPLRRALSSAMVTLREADAPAALLTLTQLIAPTRETLGVEAATVISAMVVAARERMSTPRAGIVAAPRRGG